MGRSYQFAAGDSSHLAAATPAAAVGKPVTNAERSLVAPSRVRRLSANAAAQPVSWSGCNQSRLCENPLPDR